MSDQTTNWYLKLTDMVSSPLKKIMDAATGTQKKLSDISNVTKKLNTEQNVLGRDFKRNLSQLDTTLSGLQKRQSEAFTTKHIQAYQKMIDKTKSEITRLNSAMHPPTPALGKWDKWKNNLKESASQIPGLNQGLSLMANPLALAAAAAFSLSVGLKSCVDISSNFEVGMAKINATAQLSRENLGKLDDRLTDIGSASGGNFERIPETYEKILSITGKVNQSLDLTELAVKGAKAGFTDLDIVGNALARTMSTIKDSNVKASDVLDTLMMAKNVGAGEFKDFAQYIPGLIASAQPAGYNHKDAVGLFSTLSKSFEGSEAAMYTQNLFTAFKKTDIIYGLEKAGVKVFKNGFRRPINDVLMDLAKLQKSMNPEQFTNFMDAIKLKDAQAATAIGALTGNTKNLKEVFDGLNRSLGETDRQLAATENTARGWADIGDEIKSIAKSIGDFLLPIVDVLIQGLKSIGNGFKEMFSGTVFQKSSWRDQSDDEIKSAARMKNASQIALTRTREHFNLSPDQNFDKKQWAFYQSIHRQNMTSSESKNKIVDEDKVLGSSSKSKGDAMFNANNGLAMANSAMADNQAGGSKGSSKSGGGSGSGSGTRNLTMNLTVNNVIQAGGENLDKIKRKITDFVVDAARDGMVQIGA